MILTLTEGEKNSEVWIKLMAYYTGRLEQLRLLLERESDPSTSERIRGRIAEVRSMLQSQVERARLPADAFAPF